jgi:hypothetical protein
MQAVSTPLYLNVDTRGRVVTVKKNWQDLASGYTEDC